MAQKRLYQYARADDALVIRAVSYFDNVSGQPLKNVVEYGAEPGTGRVALLGDAGGWQSVSIGIEVTADPDLLTDLLPNPKKAKQAVAPIVSVSSPGSKYRRGERLTWDGTGRWTGTVELRRSDLGKDVRIEPSLVRIQGEADVDGYACFAGAILATGGELELMFHEPGPPPSSDFAYTWTDFRTFTDEEWLRRRGDDVVFVAPELRPHVYLNERWTSLQGVLESKGTRNVNAALRNCFRAAIGQSTWVQLLVTSVGSIREVSEGEYQVLGDPWRAPLAQFVASSIFDELPADEQLKALASAFRDPDQVGIVVAKIASLAHDRSRMAKDLDAAAKLFDNEELFTEEPSE